MLQGKTINGFTLQRLLGTGGMAEVWYAENEIHKQAAVKILNEDLAHNANIVERFRNEAEIMVKLNHPNIRQVYGYGEIDGRPVIVMEYLDGNDLKAWMKNGQRFSQEELVKWWNQLVDALNYTHSQNIVHRDIKPSNIFVDHYGNVKLLDFGIAKVVETTTGTQTGSTLGTRIYMSPEQVKDPKRVGPKSDVYSLAVSFVHLLTGKAPYDSTTSSDYDIQVSIVTKPVDLSPLPEAWRNFLAPYLEKEPEQRANLWPFELLGHKPYRTDIVDEVTAVGNECQPKQKVLLTQPEKGGSVTKNKKGLVVGGVILVVAILLVGWFIAKQPSESSINQEGTESILDSIQEDTMAMPQEEKAGLAMSEDEQERLPNKVEEQPQLPEIEQNETQKPIITMPLKKPIITMPLKEEEGLTITEVEPDCLPSKSNIESMAEKAERIIIRTNPEHLEEKYGKVCFDVIFKIPAKYFESQAVMDITPTFTYNGGQVELDPVTFVGEKVADSWSDFRVNYKNGGEFTKHYCMDFAYEMESGKLIGSPMFYVYNGKIYRTRVEIIRNEYFVEGNGRTINQGILYTKPVCAAECVKVTPKGNSLVITWIGEADSFDIYINDNPIIMGVKGNSYVVEDLEAGSYSVTVKANCGDWIILDR